MRGTEGLWGWPETTTGWGGESPVTTGGKASPTRQMAAEKADGLLDRPQLRGH